MAALIASLCVCYLQALTRVFTPIQQWLYFDAVECLPSAPPAPDDRLPCGSRYDHQIALFGREFQDKLGSLQVLIVTSITLQIMITL